MGGRQRDGQSQSRGSVVVVLESRRSELSSASRELKLC